MGHMREKQGTLVLIFLLLCCRHAVYAMAGQLFGRRRDAGCVPFLYDGNGGGYAALVGGMLIFISLGIVLWRRLCIGERIGWSLCLQIMAGYLLVQSIASIVMGLTGAAVHGAIGDGESRVFLFILSRVWGGVWRAVVLSTVIIAYRGGRGWKLRKAVVVLVLRMWYLIAGYMIASALFI